MFFDQGIVHCRMQPGPNLGVKNMEIDNNLLYLIAEEIKNRVRPNLKIDKQYIKDWLFLDIVTALKQANRCGNIHYTQNDFIKPDFKSFFVFHKGVKKHVKEN